MATKVLLEPDKYYHVFNHTIGDEKLFRSDNDYSEFIVRYIQHVIPVAETIAYCLMSNHFHFCIKIKGIDELFKKSTRVKLELVESIIYRSLSHFLNGYVQKYNHRYSRMGSLFVGNFKRKPMNTDDDLRRLICYIHNNPVEAKLVPSPDKWLYSSYLDYFTENSAPKIPLDVPEIIRVFNDLENFKILHTHP
ncbi:MAG TPA: hypothetical protein VK179_03435 [Bacteroidales bacterium]|nr:hypothetical protein [Bacteroidales bacterium]